MTREESIELQDRFIHSRVVEGKSFEAISNEIGVPKKTLLSWHKDLKDRIEPMMDFRLEQQGEKYMFGTLQRVEVMGQIHKRIIDELMKRDLTDIQTPKLLDMVLSLQDKLPMPEAIRSGKEVMALEWESSKPERISIV